MGSDVSSVEKYFAKANEGFSTTTSNITGAGSNVVNLTNVDTLTDGSTFVGVIESGTSREQVFTGTVDVAGSRITSVKWTKGANIEHANGVSVVDWDTGTAHNMMAEGFKKQHKDNGDHADTITTDTINENTPSNGVTVDGVKMKDGKITTPLSVPQESIERPHYNCLYFNNNGGMVFTTQTRAPYDTSDTTNGVGIIATTGGSANMKIARDGLYLIEFKFKCIDVQANSFITWIYINEAANNNTHAVRRPAQTIPVGQGESWSNLLYLKKDDVIWQEVYNGGATRFGTNNDGSQWPDLARRMSTSFTVTEMR